MEKGRKEHMHVQYSHFGLTEYIPFLISNDFFLIFNYLWRKKKHTQVMESSQTADFLAA